MGVQTLMNIGLLVVLFTCCSNPCQALQCYSCTVLSNTGPSSNVTCSGTLRECTSAEPFCNTYSIESKDGSIYEFTRDCVVPDVCKPDFCKKTEEGLGKTNCKVKCCNTDFCNRAVIKTSSAWHGLASAVSSLGSLLLLIMNLY